MRSYRHINNPPPLGSKEKSPLHPVKEIKPDIISLGLTARRRPRVRARDQFRRRAISLAVDEALRTFSGTRGPAPSDEALWANFAWRLGDVRFREAVIQARAEMREHSEAVPDREKPKILQAVLNGYWSGTKGGAK